VGARRPSFGTAVTSPSSSAKAALGGFAGSPTAAGGFMPTASVPGVDELTMATLQNKAVALRRLIRVKMADEADLLQSVQATGILQKFCAATESVAEAAGRSPSSIIRELERGD
jgi:hypothetical protein